MNTITLHYRLDGLPAGGAPSSLRWPPLVFINSLGTDLRIWDNVVSFFANRFAVIRYDKRGHGLSDCPPGPYTIHQHAGDLAALLEQLAAPPVVLVGLSVGGMIALDFAHHYPEHVRALVLCDTGAQIGTATYWAERIDMVRQNGIAPLAESILARWFTAAFATQHPAAYRGYINMLTRTPVEGYAATCEAIRSADLHPILHTIQTPTLVLCGDEDLATPSTQGQALADALPHARFERIGQAGHIPAVEQPEALSLALDHFFREVLDD